jgi:putative DNA primase/helicase
MLLTFTSALEKAKAQYSLNTVTKSLYTRLQENKHKPQYIVAVEKSHTICRFMLTLYSGHALRFIERFGNDIGYVHEWNRWLTFEDGRWNIDGSGAAHRLAAELCKEAVAQALTIPGKDERSVALREATAWGDVRAVDDMLASARNDRRVIVRPDQLDADPWLVGARNGVADLRTGIITEHSREQLVTKSVGADFDHIAKCPRWERFLEEVFPDEAVRRFVWKAAGYSLTGLTTEHHFMFLHGRGANGKSTFLEILSTACGRLCHPGGSEAALGRRSSRCSP